MARPKALMTRAEAAQALGCSQATVSRHVLAGRLTAAATRPAGAAPNQLYLYASDVKALAADARRQAKGKGRGATDATSCGAGEKGKPPGGCGGS
jgi:predicted transcriptional regulator